MSGRCCHLPDGQLPSSLEDVHHGAADVATCNAARRGATTQWTNARISSNTHAMSSRDRSPVQPQRRRVHTKPRLRVSTATLQSGPCEPHRWASFVVNPSHSGGKTTTNDGVPVAPPMLPPVRHAHRFDRSWATSKPATWNQPSRRAPERCGLRRSPGVATWTAVSDGWTFAHGTGRPGPRGARTSASGACAPSTTALTAGRIGSQTTRTEPVGLRPRQTRDLDPRCRSEPPRSSVATSPEPPSARGPLGERTCVNASPSAGTSW